MTRKRLEIFFTDKNTIDFSNLDIKLNHKFNLYLNKCI